MVKYKVDSEQVVSRLMRVMRLRVTEILHVVFFFLVHVFLLQFFDLFQSVHVFVFLFLRFGFLVVQVILRNFCLEFLVLVIIVFFFLLVLDF